VKVVQRRTLLWGAALLVLAGLNGGVTHAQTGRFSRAICRPTSVPTTVRAEGLAERMGNIRISCIPTIGLFVGILPEQVITEINLTVRLNVAVTNHVDVYGFPNLTDAVLTVNGQNSYHPLPISQSDYAGVLNPIIGTGGPAFLSLCPSYLNPSIGFPNSPPFNPGPFFDPRWPCPQLARLAGVRSLAWDGVRAPFPGVDTFSAGFPFSIVPPFPEVTVLEIQNIRANAAELGVAEPAEIMARISIGGPTSFSLTRSQIPVAQPVVGLVSTVTPAGQGLQCFDGSPHGEITLREGFASAFKTLGAPTFATAATAGLENGYPVLEGTIELGTGTFPFALAFSPPGLNTGTGGGATQATRFMLRFQNIPAGVIASVPRLVNTDSGETSCEVDGVLGALCVQLVTGTDLNGAGGFSSGEDAPGDLYQVALDEGAGFVVYEVKDANPFALEEVDIPIWFRWEFLGESDLPAIGTGQLDVRFAPLSDVGVASNEPAPRFVDAGADPVDVITIVRCSTTLLFPFVSNRSGFDSGIAIANTSMDWKGTPPQRGSCRIHYIGKTGEAGPMPADDVSNILEGGEVMTFTLSGGNPNWDINGAPNFQGFLVAMCDFQFAHGFAFINDGGTGLPTWNQGYLALVLRFDQEGERLISGDGEAGVEDLNH
jgi:hypothetical protein